MGTLGGTDTGEKIQEFSLGHSKFEVLITHSGGDVE